MAKTNQKAVIGQAVQNDNAVNKTARQTIGGLLQSMLDSEKLRSRFEELLGKRMPQFLSSLLAMINEDEYLKEAFYNAPMTVLQAALKAASYNLPIDKSLGFAYVVTFWNSTTGRREAQLVIGYKGLIQLANRTGAYERINVVDVKEGELKHFDRLTEDVEMNWIYDDERREQLPTIGYLGYFRLINGFEKRVYMTTKQIDAHEYKHRKGDKSKGRPKIWQEHYDAMASKTVLRNMIGKWGLMSIDYMQADAQTLQFAQDIATGKLDGEDTPLTIEQKTIGNPLLVQPSAVATPAVMPEERIPVGVTAWPDQDTGVIN